MNDRSNNCFAVKFCLIIVYFLFSSLDLLVCLSILCVLFACLVVPYCFHYRFALHGSIHPSVCPKTVIGFKNLYSGVY